MDDQKRTQILGLINRLNESKEARADFASAPISSLKTALGMDQDQETDNIGAANILLLHVLKSPRTMSALTEIATDRESGAIGQDEANERAVAAIENLSPNPDIKKMIEEWKRDAHPKFDPNQIPAYVPDPKPNPHGPDPVPGFGIANIAIAVDIFVLVAAEVAYSSEYVLSGRSGEYPIRDMRRLANSLVKE